MLKNTEIDWNFALRLLVLMLAVGFICFGLLRGEAGEVLRKASNLCMECIGIG